jgi:hypothetical protein
MKHYGVVKVEVRAHTLMPMLSFLPTVISRYFYVM